MVIMENIKFHIQDLNLFYDKNHVVKGLNFDIYKNEIFTIIGPANSGKTSFLQSLNRLNDINQNFKKTGKIFMDGIDIYKDISIEDLRTRVGIVFALPIPLPLTIYDNITYGPRMHGITNKKRLDEIVEKSLKESYLWEEVKDRLQTQAMNLSGGQQQRLCISRILAVESEVILFDEPSSGLDPISTARVEEAMQILKQKYTIVLVTNMVAQAARVGDRTAFFLMGELIELDKTAKMFTTPTDQRTNDYITGKFG